LRYNAGLILSTRRSRSGYPFPFREELNVQLAVVWTWLPTVLNAFVLVLGLFLILLVLIQRGKGGGLAGAFGGVGGSSAFGSRAGDTFTRITIGVAAAWIILIMVQVVATQKAWDYYKKTETTFNVGP
jgi:preprotein translocase subunit SecG